MDGTKEYVLPSLQITNSKWWNLQWPNQLIAHLKAQWHLTCSQGVGLSNQKDHYILLHTFYFMPRNPIAQYWEVPVNLLNLACQELTTPRKFIAALRTNADPNQCIFAKGCQHRATPPLSPMSPTFQILPWPKDIQTSCASLSLPPWTNKPPFATWGGCSPPCSWTCQTSTGPPYSNNAFSFVLQICKS